MSPSTRSRTVKPVFCRAICSALSQLDQSYPLLRRPVVRSMSTTVFRENGLFDHSMSQFGPRGRLMVSTLRRRDGLEGRS